MKFFGGHLLIASPDLLDPNFARAYSSMAAVAGNLGQTQNAEKYAKLAMQHVDATDSVLGGLAAGGQGLTTTYRALIMAAFAGCGLPGFANFAGEVTVFFGAWQILPKITMFSPGETAPVA